MIYHYQIFLPAYTLCIAYFSQSISEAHEASAQEGDTAVSIS